MVRVASNRLAHLLLAAHGAFAGLTVDVENADSIKAAAALVAEDLMSFYDGEEPGNVPGLLPAYPDDNKPTYYWWTGGALWGALLDYRSRSANNKYDQSISKGLLFQVGPNDNYLPMNWTNQIGNEDQAIWALSALTANQTGLQEGNDEPSWISVADNVFNEQSAVERRLADGECAGALRWMLFSFSNGYDYINTASNGAYMNLAAQLYRLTGNETYGDAASRTWDILTRIGFVTDDFKVYDGAHAEECTSDVNKSQFSYPAALLIQSAAYMYNKTGDDDWKERLDGLLDQTLKTFFPDGVAFEVACEEKSLCTTDMHFFKSVLHRSLASTAQIAPYTSSKILPVLKSSAKKAVEQCTGGDNGRMCGFEWSTGKFDGKTGPAQQMGVLSALTALMPAQGSAAGNGSGSGNGSGNGNAEGTTGGDKPGNSGARASISLGALIGSLLLGSFLL